jgi:CxxC motif-containing protein
MSNKLSAGEYLASYCTKCKLDLGHTIIVMDGEKVLRVKCNTCGSEHIHRDKTKKKTTKTRKTSSVKRATPTKSVERRWDEAIAKATGEEIPYNMKAAFKPGDVVLHDIFGQGVVLELNPKKMTIIFKDKERVLVAAN